MESPTGSGATISALSLVALDFIVNYKKDNDGQFPKYEEIGRALGVSKSTAWYRVERMMLEGLLERNENGKLVVVGGEWIWHSNSRLTS